jgi:hypothetical protein
LRHGLGWTVGENPERVGFDLPTLLTSKLLVQANSGGGKSDFLRFLLEQTYAEVQQIVIDVEDEFYTLRPTFPDYILAGRGGGADCAAEPGTAALLARKLLELRTSAILRIYELKAHERLLFVERFLDAMVNAPKELWHPVLLVIDEAHIFCPERGTGRQKKRDGADACANAVIDMMTRGRKREFCTVLATQRIAALSNMAAAECNNKLIGRSALDVDMKRAAFELGISGKEVLALRSLAPGDFYAFGPALTPTPVRIHAERPQTSHPKVGAKATKPAAAGDRVRAVLAQLADLPAEAQAEARTLAEAQAQIREFEKKLRALPKPAEPLAAPAAKEKSVLKAADLKRLDAALNKLETAESVFQGGIRKAIDSLSQRQQVVVNEIGTLRTLIERANESNKREGAVVAQGRSALAPAAAAPHVSRAPVAARHSVDLSEGTIRLGQARERIVAALVNAGRPLSRRELGVWSILSSTGGTFNTYVPQLLREGLVEDVGGGLSATHAGRASLSRPPGDLAPGNAQRRQKAWLNELSAGAMQAMFESLLKLYPERVTREQLGAEAGISHTGGTFNTYFPKLKRLGLIDVDGKKVRASEHLFAETA